MGRVILLAAVVAAGPAWAEQGQATWTHLPEMPFALQVRGPNVLCATLVGTTWRTYPPRQDGNCYASDALHPSTLR